MCQANSYESRCALDIIPKLRAEIAELEKNNENREKLQSLRRQLIKAEADTN